MKVGRGARLNRARFRPMTFCSNCLSVPIMDIQAVRRANLRRILDDMAPARTTKAEALMVLLDNPVCPKRLAAMLEGSNIGTLFARHVEHCLRLERGWMDSPHEDAVV